MTCLSIKTLASLQRLLTALTIQFSFTRKQFELKAVDNLSMFKQETLNGQEIHQKDREVWENNIVWFVIQDGGSEYVHREDVLFCL